MKCSAIAAPAYGATYCSGAGSEEVCVNDDRVIERPVLAESLDNGRRGTGSLAAGDVDADYVAPLLVDDGVEGDGRLTRLPGPR